MHDPELTNVIQTATSQFTSANLRMPYVPEEFVPDLRVLSDWIYTTRDDDRKPYAFDSFVDDYFNDPYQTPYLLFGHDGHGFNSYAMHYYLVYGQVAIFDQIAWGGVYMEQSKLADDFVSAGFAQLEGLVDGVTEAVDSGLLRPDERIIIANAGWGHKRWAWWTIGSEIEWAYGQMGINTILAASIAMDELLGKT